MSDSGGEFGVIKEGAKSPGNVNLTILKGIGAGLGGLEERQADVTGVGLEEGLGKALEAWELGAGGNSALGDFPCGMIGARRGTPDPAACGKAEREEDRPFCNKPSDRTSHYG